jgi:predicted MPP superfamily phosphohydrolase
VDAHHIVFVSCVHLGRAVINVNWFDGIMHGFMGISDKNAVAGEQLESRFRNLIQKLNDLKPSLVVFLGDITESASQKQFEDAQKILALLEIPSLILMGNHDVWPYTRDQRGKVDYNAERPLTIAEFEAIFASQFSGLPFQPIRQGEKYQNMAFTFSNTKFIVLDTVNRDASPFGMPGAVGLPKTHPETKRWLQQQLAATTEDQIIIMSHSPIPKKLLQNPPAGKKILCIAGHNHKITRRKLGRVTQVTIGAILYEPACFTVNPMNLNYGFLSF